MLRVATRAAHDRVDALFSELDLNRIADYRRFLTAQAAAFLPVEAALDAAGAAALFPDWPERRRSAALRADVQALGLTLPAPIAGLSFATPAEVAGGAYVLEGSRLGGALLSRSLAHDVPRLFLSAPPGGAHWRDFLAQLEQLLPLQVQRQQAIRGANLVFDVFAHAARVALGTR